jgi:hypothetical protein
MPAIERRERVAYYAPTRRRHYFTRKAAAWGEATAQLLRKYPTEKGDESDGYYHWHWQSDERLIKAAERLYRRILRSMITKR